MKTFEDAEKSPFFRKGDILLYLVLVLVIVGLFCFGFATKEEGELENLLVYRDDTLVFSYSFAEDKYNAYEEVKVDLQKLRRIVEGHTDMLHLALILQFLGDLKCTAVMVLIVIFL